MLSYFRINDPYRLLGLLILLVCMALPLLIQLPPVTFPVLKASIVGEKTADGFSLYTSIIDFTAPFTGWFEALFNLVFGKSLLARYIIGVLFVFLQAVYLAVIFINKKVFPESSFVPPLIYVVLFLFSFDALPVSAELLGLFFLLLALDNIFNELEFRAEGSHLVLKTGFFIGIASLFSFSNIVYLAGSFVILLLFSRSTPQKLLLLVTAFVIPHILLFAAFAINDHSAALWSYFYLPNLSFDNVYYLSGAALLGYSVVPGIFFILSLFVINRESRFTKYQSQILQAMFFWTVFAVLQIFYSREIRPQSFITLIPSLSFFFSHLFLTIRRRKIAEMLFLLFFAGILTVSFYERYSINETKYDNLVVGNTKLPATGRSVVVLDNNLAYYRQSRMATPFLNWQLCSHIFREPDYYENVLMVYRGFSADPPDVIIDPDNLMRPFLDRIPVLRKQYRKQGDIYLRTVISN